MNLVEPRPMVPNTYANYLEIARQNLNTIRPGLTGIGSIVFRDKQRYLADQDHPMEFYVEHITPYKSNLEMWFVDNN